MHKTNLKLLFLHSMTRSLPVQSFHLHLWIVLLSWKIGIFFFLSLLQQIAIFILLCLLFPVWSDLFSASWAYTSFWVFLRFVYDAFVWYMCAVFIISSRTRQFYFSFPFASFVLFTIKEFTFLTFFHIFLFFFRGIKNKRIWKKPFVKVVFPFLILFVKTLIFFVKTLLSHQFLIWRRVYDLFTFEMEYPWCWNLFVGIKSIGIKIKIEKWFIFEKVW